MGIILDVAEYPTFLKWVTSARAKRSGPDKTDADVLIGHRLFTAPISARLVRCGLGRVDILYRRGPIRDLSSTWTVAPTSDDDGSQTRTGCLVSVVVDIQPGLLLSPIVNGALDRGLTRLVESFEARAHSLYGRSGTAAVARSPDYPDISP